jgi:cell division protein FtsL
MSQAAWAYPEEWSYGHPVERPSRPAFEVVRGKGHRIPGEPVLSPAHHTAFQMVMVAIVFLAIVCIGRVWLSAATASTTVNSQEITSQISAAYSTGADLEVQHAVLSNPTRIQKIATDTLGMVPATSVSYVDLSSSSAATVVGATSSSTISLAVAVSQIQTAGGTSTTASDE